MIKFTITTFFIFILVNTSFASNDASYILVLGVTQDGGYPQAGCNKECCKSVWNDLSMRKYVVSLALVDPIEKKWWLIEATPDIREQLHLFQKLTHGEFKYLPEAIFITHAHIGHYTGLMEFGKEVMNTHQLPVFVLPRMKKFLETNGPWSQLVSLNNIQLHELHDNELQILNKQIGIKAFTVPHRDEYSETAGFKILMNQKTSVFIPDINKWSRWSENIHELVNNSELAFLDATFFDQNELPGRDMNEIQHPFVFETMLHFAKDSKETCSKIVFIHFNHTNRLLWSEETRKSILSQGFRIAEQGMRY